MYIRYLLIDSFIYPTCNSVAKLQDVLLINLLTYLLEEKGEGHGPPLLRNDTLKAICGENWDDQIIEMVPVKPGEQFLESTFSYAIELYFHLLIPK